MAYNKQVSKTDERYINALAIKYQVIMGYDGTDIKSGDVNITVDLWVIDASREIEPRFRSSAIPIVRHSRCSVDFDANTISLNGENIVLANHDMVMALIKDDFRKHILDVEGTCAAV